MILYLDCASGVSGDMLVAGLLALNGDTPERSRALDLHVRPALKAAGIDPRLVTLGSVVRGGVAALEFRVASAPGFATFDELIMSMYASPVEREVADAVAAVAERMKAAERQVHGPEGDHLHELSDVDTAVDLISTVVLLRQLRPERVLASPPAVGNGTVDTAHGLLPVPAPAVAALLEGLPWVTGAEGPDGADDPQLGELATPTGAALLAQFADGFGPIPPGKITRSGYGAGQREVPGRPNVLRALLVEPDPGPAGRPDAAEVAGEQPAGTGGEAQPDVSDRSASGEQASAAASPVTPAGEASGTHVVLEANIDDMSPELLAHAAEMLREAGAADVWMTQALMKKGRPGVVFHVLAATGDRQRLADLIFSETSTFGLRVVPVDRIYVEERRETVTVGRLEVRVRLGFVAGRLVTVSPEYEDVRRVADQYRRPAKVVYEAAQAVAHSRFKGS